MSKLIGCYVMGHCPCCTCNGVSCMMWHPGHDHKFDQKGKTAVEILAELIEDKDE